MTYSNPYASTSSPTNFIAFSGMGMRKGGRAMLMPSNYQGDGSTLNLDFTTGVLDSRLTFSRASAATFVNSSGYVEYAAHNLYYNTNFATISTVGSNPSLTGKGWSYVFSTGSATFNVDGSVTMSASAQRVGLLRSAGFAGTGRRLIFSVDITSVGDTGLPPAQLVNEGTKTNDAYYIDGTLWTSGNVVGPCTLSFVFTSNPAGNAATYFGIGMSSNSTGVVTFANPRWGFYGGVNQLAYSPNTSATNANYLTAEYHAPRFDYSPTTIGEPRGLLIEGSSTNLFSYSEDFSNGSWLKSNATASTNATTAPDGNATADYMWETAGTSTRYFAKDSGSPGTSTETRTFSVYVKGGLERQYVSLSAANGVGGPYYRITANLSTGTISSTDLDNDGTWFTTPTNSISPAGPAGSGWYRITITSRWCQYYLICPSDAADPGNSSTNWGLGSAYSGNTNKGVILWGAQLEAGSGASSYIPTGASQVTRTADTCYLTDFAGWSAGGNFNTAEGTLFVDQAVTFVGTANYPAGGFCTSNTVGSRFGWQYRQGEAPQTYRGLVNAGYLFEMPGGAGWSIPAGTTRFRHAMSCGGNTFLRQSFKSSASSGSPTQNNYSDVSTLNISGVAAFTLTQSAFASSVRIARVKYYPRAFTLTELDQLTN